MAKGSGGTGGGKGGGTSRGQQLRDKFGNPAQAANTKIIDRFQRSQKTEKALINTAISADTRKAIKSADRSGSEVAATEKALARRARKQGKAPRGGTQRAAVQKEAQRVTRNDNAAAERAIIGKSNVKRAKRSGRVSPATAAKTGRPRNINF